MSSGRSPWWTPWGSTGDRSGTIPVGGGTVEIAHGRMGVPAPATARLLEGYDIVGGPEMRELTTPDRGSVGGRTGSRVRGHAGDDGRRQVGLRRRLHEAGARPQRAASGRGQGESTRRARRSRRWPDGDQVVELQTNLDDVSPEVIGHAIRLLREAGALDVWTVSGTDEEGPAGSGAACACRARNERPLLTALMFEQTGTLGVRRQMVSRHVAERGSVSGDGERERRWGSSGAVGRAGWSASRPSTRTRRGRPGRPGCR